MRKSRQADLLHPRLGACHLSTGDVFGTAGKRAECDQIPAMKEALGYMRRGVLVPDSTVWEMGRERLACLHCGGGFMLDGFPLTLAQAESLNPLLDTEGIWLFAVLSNELWANEIVARPGGRRTGEKRKAAYPVTERPPKLEGPCDGCDGKLFQRDDRSAGIDQSSAGDR